MQFTRFISSFFLLVTFGVFALATPTKRASDASVQAVLTNLQSSLAPTLAAISKLHSSPHTLKRF